MEFTRAQRDAIRRDMALSDHAMILALVKSALDEKTNRLLEQECERMEAQRKATSPHMRESSPFTDGAIGTPRLNTVTVNGVTYLHPDEVRAKDRRIAELEAQRDAAQGVYQAALDEAKAADNRLLAAKDEKIRELRRQRDAANADALFHYEARDQARRTMEMQASMLSTLSEQKARDEATIAKLTDVVHKAANPPLCIRKDDHDRLLAEKDAEIARLRGEVETLSNLDRVNARDIKTTVAAYNKAKEEIAELSAEIARQKNALQFGHETVQKFAGERDEARAKVTQLKKQLYLADMYRGLAGNALTAITLKERDEARKNYEELREKYADLDTFARKMERRANESSKLYGEIDRLTIDLRRLCDAITVGYPIDVVLTEKEIRITPRVRMADFYLPTTIERA